MTIDDFAKLIEILKIAGPWSFIIVLCVALKTLYSENKVLNTTLLALAKEQTPILVQNTENQKQLISAFIEFKRDLEK